VCQNGVMDYVLHPIEPLSIRLTVAGAFCQLLGEDSTGQRNTLIF
jgi:hypothetical protein